MRLDVTSRTGKLRETTRQMAERRVEEALDRFGPLVERVEVLVRDVNGPKGGHDKACRLTARLRGGEMLTVTDHDSELAAAVARGAERLERAVARSLERRREGRRRAPRGDLSRLNRGRRTGE